MDTVATIDHRLTQAETLVHLLRKGLQEARCYVGNNPQKAKMDALIEASEAYWLGPPVVCEGDYMQVGNEQWQIDRDGDRNGQIAVKTPRSSTFVFRVSTEELLAAGVTVVKGNPHD